MLKKLVPLLIAALLISFSSFAATTPQKPKDRISMKQAQEIATKAQAGKIESKELEYENNLWIYSFDIRANDKLIHEVQVDAKSGKIVSQTIENATQEKAEATSDKK